MGVPFERTQEIAGWADDAINTVSENIPDDEQISRIGNELRKVKEEHNLTAEEEVILFAILGISLFIYEMLG